MSFLSSAQPASETATPSESSIDTSAHPFGKESRLKRTFRPPEIVFNPAATQPLSEVRRLRFSQDGFTSARFC